MKSTLNLAVLIVVGFSASRQTVDAQEVDAYVGVGTARNSSNGQQIDTFGDNTPHAAPGMGGIFTDFGINVFFNRQVGVGWTASWKWTSADYAGLRYRSAFHVFDGIFQPARIRTNRFVPELRAGIGVTSVHFEFDDQQACDRVPGCPGSRFFLAHVAGAARLYVSSHVFVRPAVDLHYVNHFFPFGSQWVPRYSISLGYSFGKE
jgi:opacity protein-like surface antigen